jgi:hypothetical protein
VPFHWIERYLTTGYYPEYFWKKYVFEDLLTLILYMCTNNFLTCPNHGIYD